MSDLFEVWRFTRERLSQALHGLKEEQLNWRMYPGCHTIAELVFHIAGAEHYWATRLGMKNPAGNEYEAKLDRSVQDGFLRDGSIPMGPGPHPASDVQKALDYAQAEIEPILRDTTDLQKTMVLTSPIGDEVKGNQGLIRLVQHAGYHTGQIWMVRSHPDFPG